MMIERMEIINWRRQYLRQVRAYRAAGKRVYYLDETWVCAGHTTSRKWVDTTVKTAAEALRRGLSFGLQDPTSKGARLIIVHIGSDAGFVDGALYMYESSRGADYHHDMNGEVFEAWLSSVLPELEPGSVIVLDNASYHSRKTEKIPNTSWKKSDIIEWLHGKGVLSANLSLLKAELLGLVYNLHIEPTYVVDEMIKQSARFVLRTPPYHCTLNPIEMAWANLKAYIARRNRTFKLDEAKELFAEAVAQFTPENWRDCVNHVIEQVEQEMWTLDDIIEKEISVEPVIITFTDSDFEDSD